MVLVRGDTDVQLAIEQPALERRRLGDVERDMDSMVAAHEAGDGLVDARFRVGDRVVHYADVQIAEKLAAQRPHFGLKILVGGEQLLRGRIDALALVGKPKSNPATRRVSSAAILVLSAEALMLSSAWAGVKPPHSTTVQNSRSKFASTLSSRGVPCGMAAP